MGFLMCIRKIGTHKNLYHILLFAALGLFVALSLTRIRQTIGEDELVWLIAAKNYFRHGIPYFYESPGKLAVFSPHLYLLTLVSAFSLFGESDVVARMVGVVSGSLSIIMVFSITKLLSHGDRINRERCAFLSCLLYSLTPILIQGSVIMEIDSTVLIPAILFLCLSFTKYQQTDQFGWAVLTGLAMTLALWGRITTTPIVAFLMILYVLFGTKPLRSKLIFLSAIISGTIFFVISWYLYCITQSIPFSAPFIYTLETFLQKSQSSGGLTSSKASLSLIHLILWIGIFPLILALIFTVQRSINFFKYYKVHIEDIFIISGLIIMGGYTLIGGIPFGYPKYQSPGIPLIFIFIGTTLSQSKINFACFNIRKFAFTVIIVCVIQIFVAGDILYILRYTLRESVALMLPLYPVIKDVLFRGGVSFSAYAILFAAVHRFSVTKSMIGLLILFALGSNIGTSLLQATAGYHTGYNYGGRQTIEAAHYIQGKVPLQSTVIVPSEILYYLKSPKSRHLPSHLWTQKEKLKQQLNDQGVSCFAYSIVTNSIKQVKTISSDKQIQEILHEKFDHVEIGSYKIWIRKK